MSTPVPFSAEKVADLRKRHDQGEVVGLQDVSGIRPRLDIDVLLFTDPTCFNLFLLAMQDLQQDLELMKSSMGYFEIAGIHGLPKRAWKKVEHNNKTGGGLKKTPMGYCEHSSFKFPTWHRPYLLMLEQAIYLQMVKRAQTFPDVNVQLEAVQKFRLPYWDYFRPRDYATTFPGVTSGKGYTAFPYDFSVPQVLTVERIIVAEAQNGKVAKKFIPNPLRSYFFPLENGLLEDDWKLLSGDTSAYYARFAKGHTVRHGLRYFITQKDIDKDPNVSKEKFLDQARKNQNRNTRASQQGNDENLSLSVNKARAQTLTNMREMILSKSAPLTGYKSYENFATNRKPDGEAGRGGKDQPAGSIEDFHNGWHVNIGSVVGHMGHPGIASFDPIFWFHHANIDRYLALWQEVNPTAWFNERPNLVKEELLPFFSNATGNTNGFWNSVMVRNTHNMGYEYPDIVRGDIQGTVRKFEQQELWSLPKENDKNASITAPADKTPIDLSGTLAFAGHPEYLPPFSESSGILKQPVFAARMATQQVVQLATATIEKVTATEDPSTEAPATEAPPATNITLEEIDFDEFLPMEGSEISVDWYIDVEVERLALNGPFALYYFIGDSGGEVKVKPADYAIAPTLAGIFYNFASPVEACDNCGVQAEEQLKITGTTNISHILRDYVINHSLKSLQSEDVLPFLKDRLRWRVVDSQGEKSDPRELSRKHGLRLLVNSVSYVSDGAVTKPELKPYPEVVEAITGTSAARQPMTNDVEIGLYRF